MEREVAQFLDVRTVDEYVDFREQVVRRLVVARLEFFERVARVAPDVEACRVDLGRGGEAAKDCADALAQGEQRIEAFRRQLKRLWESPAATRRFSSCRVIVPGRIGANVEVSIGEAHAVIPEDTRDAVVRYQDGEIVVEHPALRK